MIGYLCQGDRTKSSQNTSENQSLYKTMMLNARRMIFKGLYISDDKSQIRDRRKSQRQELSSNEIKPQKITWTQSENSDDSFCTRVWSLGANVGEYTALNSHVYLSISNHTTKQIQTIKKNLITAIFEEMASYLRTERHVITMASSGVMLITSQAFFYDSSICNNSFNPLNNPMREL